MRSYCSVKQAAKLLGVSTNTVYQYVKEGKLTVRRIGRGRIRIPLKELTPFLPQATPAPETQLVASPLVQSKENTVGFVESPSEEEKEVICPGRGDIIFYRLFKGLFILGLGAVYLLTKVSYFDSLNLSYPFSFFFKILPLALIIAGSLCFYKIFSEEKIERWDGWVHFYQILVLGFTLYISLSAKHFGLSIFLGGILVMISSHFARGFNLENPNSTFKTQFIKFSLTLVLVSTLFFFLEEKPFPLNSLVELSKGRNELAAFFWLIAFVPLFLFLLSPKGRESKIGDFILAIYGILILFLASWLSVRSTWDVSYLTFLTAFFGIFLSFWEFADIKILKEKVYVLIFTGLWVSISIVLSLSAIENVKERVVRRTSNLLSQNLDEVSYDIKSLFDQQNFLLIRFSQNEELKKAVLAKDKEKSLEFARKIYEESKFARRVSIFDKDGISISAYPRNSLVEGTNFSSRDYYQVTKESHRSYVTNVFLGVTGVPIVLQTEPILTGNEFNGLIGLVYSLSDLNKHVFQEVGPSFKVWAVDKNGVYVLGDEDKIGTKFSPKDFFDQQKLVETKSSLTPDWKIYIGTQVNYLADEISDVVFFVSSVLTVNVVLSLMIGLSLSRKNKLLIGLPKSFSLQTLGGS